MKKNTSYAAKALLAALAVAALAGCASTGPSTASPSTEAPTVSAFADPSPAPASGSDSSAGQGNIDWTNGNTVTRPFVLFTLDLSTDWKLDNTQTNADRQIYSSASTGCSVMLASGPMKDSELVPGDDKASTLKAASQTFQDHPGVAAGLTEDKVSFNDSNHTVDVLASRFQAPKGYNYFTMRVFSNAKRAVMAGIQCTTEAQLKANTAAALKAITISNAY